MSGRHLPIRKRPNKRPILPRPADDIPPQRTTRLHPQLRSLAPKRKASPCHSVSPVQHRLQLEYNNVCNEQDTEEPTAATPNLATSQLYIPLKSVSSSHNSASPSLLHARGNLLRGARVATRESRSHSTQHPQYSSSKCQETAQNRQSQDYWVPTYDTSEVWTAMVQPTLGIHQSRCSLPNRTLCKAETNTCWYPPCSRSNAPIGCHSTSYISPSRST